MTGTAGFIGNHVALALLERGRRVVGIDNLTPYYDVRLKERRLARLTAHAGFVEARVDLADRDATAAVFARHRPARVIHLAAQAGVRYGATDPHAYADSNLTGFLNVLEGCRHTGCGHLLFASSSSVYGANDTLPFGEDDPVDHPISLYAATKRANELMAHAYSHLYGFAATGLRFFTVYGPWGRPDMALFKFTRAMLAGEPIPVFNHGRMRRDFTFIDDVVSAILEIVERPPAAVAAEAGAGAAGPAVSRVAGFRILNIGNHRPVELMRYIAVLEAALGRKAVIDFQEMAPGDVPATFADVAALAAVTGGRPSTPVEVGIGRFVAWYRDFYGDGG